jgi:putative aminopeptidase FrvX
MILKSKMNAQEVNTKIKDEGFSDKKPNVDNAYQITEKLAFPRLVSSKGEKKAIQIILDELNKLEYKSIHRESFKTSFYNWIFLRYAFLLPGVCLLLLAASFFINSWLTLGFIAINIYIASKILGLATSDKIHLLKDKEKNYDTENIFVDLKSNDPKATVVFMGHWDSKSQTFPSSIRIIIILITLLSFFTILILYFVFAIIDLIFTFNSPIIAIALIYTSTAFAIIANLNYFNKTGNKSPGAYDNAAAVGVIIELARYFKSNPIKNTNFIFLSTSSEELNLGGAKYFIQNHKHEFDKDNTFFINLDLIGGQEFIRLITSYGMPRKTASKRLNELILKSGERLNIEIKDIYVPTGAWSDFIPIVQEGFEACWIGSQPGLKYVHTKKDNMNLVSKDGLRNVLFLCIDVVNKINDEFNL